MERKYFLERKLTFSIFDEEKTVLINYESKKLNERGLYLTKGYEACFF